MTSILTASRTLGVIGSRTGLICAADVFVLFVSRKLDRPKTSCEKLEEPSASASVLEKAHATLPVVG